MLSAEVVIELLKKEDKANSKKESSDGMKKKLKELEKAISGLSLSI